MKWQVLLAGLCLLNHTAMCADLQGDLYRMAKQSKFLKHLTLSTYESFIESADTSYVAVLYHIGTCHICKDALPTLELVAQDFAAGEVDMTVGHLDCTADSSRIKEKLHITGFPCLRFYRRNMKDSSEAWLALRGEFAHITADPALVVAASREAGMTKEKDNRRLALLGHEVKLQDIALEDYTVQVVLKGIGKVWLPFEAVESLSEGKPVPPFTRNEGSFQYRPKSWQRDAMQDFLLRMMRPLVTEISSAQQFAKEMLNESQAAIVLCGGEPAAPLLKVARAWQDQHRFFTAASPELCPVSQKEKDGSPLLAVYSPPHQQWSPSGRANSAAVVAGNGMATGSWGPIASWVGVNRFPGIWDVGYLNFPELVNSPKSVVLTAIEPNNAKENQLVLEQILRAAGPTLAAGKGGPDIYPSSNTSFQWGVVDGTLNGLDSFGISRWSLPRAVVLENKDTWVEDEDELRVFSLKEDLRRLDTIWRRRAGIRGYPIVIARDVLKMWKQIDSWAEKTGGDAMRLAVVAGIAVGILLMCRLGVRISTAMVSSILSSDTEPEKEKQS
mmetsp:Transcript_45413/g.83028  ORF Transcript_45413/g.83028 Transcript_45413/m.83028 type:complete len:557 (+) Transcript_45413:72-1742(+)